MGGCPEPLSNEGVSETRGFSMGLRGRGWVSALLSLRNVFVFLCVNYFVRKESILVVLFYLVLFGSLYFVLRIVFSSATVVQLLVRLILLAFYVFIVVSIAKSIPGFIKAEFIVSEPSEEGVCRHGIWLCSLIIFRIERGVRSFSPCVYGEDCRSYLILDENHSGYIVFEVHAFTNKNLVRKVRELEERLREYFNMRGYVVSKIPFNRKIVFRLRRVEVNDNFSVPMKFTGPVVLCFEGNRRFGFYVLGKRETVLQRAVAYAELTPSVLSQLVSAFVESIEATGFIEKKAGEEVLLGYYMEGLNVTSRPVAIPVSRIVHALIAGMTGAGKTTFLAHFISELARLGKRVLILDWHGEFSAIRGAKHYVAGYNYSINPLAYFTIDDFIECLVSVSREVFRGYEFTPMTRQQLVQAYYRAKSVKENVTLRDVYCELYAMLSEVPSSRQDIAAAIQAVMRRIEPLLNRAFNSNNFTLNFDGVVVVDLSALDVYSRAVFANILLTMLYYFWDKGELILVADEVSNYATRDYQGDSILVRLADQVRKYGIRIIAADQQPHRLHTSVRNMAKTIIVFNPGVDALEWCVEALLPFLGKRNLREILRHELNYLGPGEAFVADREFGFTKIKVPYVKLAKAIEVRRFIKRIQLELADEREEFIKSVQAKYSIVSEEKKALDEEVLREVARRNSISLEELIEAMNECPREVFEQLVKIRDIETLKALRLVKEKEGKLKKTNRGKALASLYNLREEYEALF